MDELLLAVLERHLRKAKCCGTCNYYAEYGCDKHSVCTMYGDHETDKTLVCDGYAPFKGD